MNEQLDIIHKLREDGLISTAYLGELLGVSIHTAQKIFQVAPRASKDRLNKTPTYPIANRHHKAIKLLADNDRRIRRCTK